jgi:hypothetical protein
MADIQSREQIEVLRSLKSLQLCNQQPLSGLDAYLAVPPSTVSEIPTPVESNESVDAWVARVEKLPIDLFVAEVRHELCRLNPGLEGSLELIVTQGQITELKVGEGVVSDLRPVAAIKGLKTLQLGYQPAGSKRRPLTDLRPLSGLKDLIDVQLEFCSELRDLSPLFDKPLQRLSLYATPQPDLAWITNSRIQILNLGGRETPLDLSFVKGSQVVLLELNESATRDLSPLVGVPLQYLSFASTSVKDITPLQEMPLYELDLRTTRVEDLSPLKTLKLLKTLRCDIQNEQELEFVRSLTWLESVNRLPRENLATIHPRERMIPPDLPLPASLSTSIPITGPDQTISEEAVRTLAQTVHAKLTSLNPGYDAKLVFDVRAGRIVRWEINSKVLDNISPLADLPDLESIHFWSVQNVVRGLKDLTPLRNCQLKQVSLQRLVQLQDFSPLTGMPVEVLNVYGTPMPDVSWLRTLNLRELQIGGRDEAVDLSFLTSMSKLRILGIEDAPFDDVRPLSGLNLDILKAMNTRIRDISPLKSMPLSELYLRECPLSDLSPVRDLPRIKKLACPIRGPEDRNVLRSLPNLIELNLLLVLGMCSPVVGADHSLPVMQAPQLHRGNETDKIIGSSPFFQCGVGPPRFERRPTCRKRRELLVGRRGEAPLVPPYILPRFKGKHRRPLAHLSRLSKGVLRSSDLVESELSAVSRNVRRIGCRGNRIEISGLTPANAARVLSFRLNAAVYRHHDRFPIGVARWSDLLCAAVIP